MSGKYAELGRAKASDRVEVTFELSRLVEKRLKMASRIWAAEVEYRGGRVDYVGFRPAHGNYRGAASVERGTFEFYEVKSCMDDFESGHGLNFSGDRNYLVCPRGLAEGLKGSLSIPADVGVLVPDSGWRRLVPFVTVPEGELYGRRQASAAELLWAIVEQSYRVEAGIVGEGL